MQEKLVFRSHDNRNNIIVYKKGLGVYRKDFVSNEFGGKVGKLLEIEVSEGICFIFLHSVFILCNDYLIIDSLIFIIILKTNYNFQLGIWKMLMHQAIK